MIAAVVQLTSTEDVKHNLARIKERVAQAAAAGAELVVLPENFAFFGNEEKKRALAEGLDGPSHGPILATLAELASKHGVDLVGGGMPERSKDHARPYNTSVHLAPNGAVVARYRKMHLFDVALADGTTLRESNATSPGAGVTITEVGDVKLGMTICYDLRFPELFRALGGEGARIVTVPSAFTVTTGKDHWHVLLRARAIENQVYVLAAAQHGKHPGGRSTYGKSVIVDPWGDVIAQAQEGESLALARLDFAYLDQVRTQLPCLTHVRLGPHATVPPDVASVPNVKGTFEA
ncbi:MAG: carbon-nitrogen hydrolase family protein [Polyangiaceae bacterium]